jgi:hypothetical protein
MLKPRFMLRIAKTNLKLEIWVNDIPVFYLDVQEGVSPSAVPLNAYLLKGNNKCSVIVHAGSRPSSSAEPWTTDPAASKYTGPGTLSISIGKESIYQDYGAQQPPQYLALNWHGQVSANPLRLDRDFSVDEPLGPWKWETATPWRTLDAALRAEAMEYLQRLYGMLAEGQFEKYIAESQVKLEELTAKAFGAPLEATREDMLEALKQNSALPYKLQPLKAAEVDMRLAANGRMISCEYANRDPVFLFLNTEDPSEKFALPVMIGKIGAKWCILR